MTGQIVIDHVNNGYVVTVNNDVGVQVYVMEDQEPPQTVLDLVFHLREENAAREAHAPAPVKQEKKVVQPRKQEEILV